ncbi:MAG: SH3 domain-containing protein [Bellilinea sp.]
MNSRRAKPRYSLWIVPAGLILGAVLLGVLVAAANIFRSGNKATQDATAVLTVIYAPTSTPVFLSTLAVTPSPTPGAAGLTIGGIGQGIFVQISGTEGNGLRLRKDPGTNADILFLGYESEVFKVTDGPKEMDGYIWWHLTAPYDTNRSGWAASNYLTVIESEP